MRFIDSDKNSDEHMPITNGKYDSHKLLCRDLEELKTQAEASNAEIVIAGDFNEQSILEHHLTTTLTVDNPGMGNTQAASQ